MVAEGQSASAVARSLNVSEKLLSRWKSQQSNQIGKQKVGQTDEVALLKSQIRRVEMERDILSSHAKVIRYFVPICSNMASNPLHKLAGVRKSKGLNSTDFYGLCKGWPIIFVIFFSPANNGTNPVDQLVANGIQNQSHRRTDRMLALTEFAYIVVLKIAFHLDGRRSAHMNQ